MLTKNTEGLYSGYVWQIVTMRYNFDQFGGSISVDSMKGILVLKWNSHIFYYI